MATAIDFQLEYQFVMEKGNLALKVFLVAPAIVNDLGAIIVIAVFYTTELNLQYLFTHLGLLALLWILNILKFKKIPVVHIVGIMEWYSFYQSGVLATIAGLLLTFLTPIKRELDFSVLHNKY